MFERRLFSLAVVLLMTIAQETMGQTQPAMTTDAPQITVQQFDKLWNYSKPAETEVKFRALLPEAEASGDVDLHLQLLTQIGRTLSLQRKFEEAHALLDTVAERLKEHGQAVRRAPVRYELERGRTYNSSNQKTKATEHFLRALELGTANGEENLAVDAAHMLGIAAEGAKALEWNEKAVALAEAASDPKAKGWLGALYNNIGWTYHDMGKYDIALEYFERDLAWYEERKLQNESNIARWSIAKMHRLLGNVEQAFAMQSARAKAMETSGEEPDGYVYEELAECEFALGKPEHKQHFKRAYELLSQDSWFMANESARAERLKQLGE